MARFLESIIPLTVATFFVFVAAPMFAYATSLTAAARPDVAGMFAALTIGTLGCGVLALLSWADVL